MDERRFAEITGGYGGLRVVVVGDFCLDRYLEIAPALEETSLETGLPAHQVVRVRPQGGGAGNVLANVAAVGPASLAAVGVAGDDGEGYELARVLAGLGANLGGFIRTAARHTFTYTKPLLVRPGQPPEELSRLDIKDHQPMGEELTGRLIADFRAAAEVADVVILMDQAPATANGVLCGAVKRAIADWSAGGGAAGKTVIADSRTDIGGFAGVDIKVNESEVRRHFDDERTGAAELAGKWSAEIGRRVFVTLGPDGMVGAAPDGDVHRVAGVPVGGEIDIVGAGDTVLAHLALALAAGASVAEAITLANLAGSIVVRKIGTTGTAGIEELREALRLISAALPRGGEGNTNYRD